MLYLFRFVLAFFLSVFFVLIPKDKNKIVFNSYRNEKYNFYSRVLFEYCIRNKDNLELTCYFVVNDKSLRDELNKRIGDHFISSYSLSGIIKCLHAKFWVASCKPIYSNPFSFVGRRSINLWHGTPLKKVGLDDKYQSKIKKIIYRYYYSYLFYDVFVSPSNEVKNIIKRSFSIKEKNIFVGGSVIGDMFGMSIDTQQNKLFASILEKGRKKKILYAPTYRDGGSTLFFPFDDLSKDKMERFLYENDITIYIRPHHLDVNYKKFLDWKGIEYLGNDVISEITFYLDSFNILITDYSGIIFDYLLTDGSMIYIPYDYKVYKDSRGLNYALDDICCGDVVSTMEEFFLAISRTQSVNPIYKEHVRKKDIVRKRFHSKVSNQSKELITFLRKQ